VSGAAEDLMLMTRENQAVTYELIDRYLDGECADADADADLNAALTMFR